MDVSAFDFHFVSEYQIDEPAVSNIADLLFNRKQDESNEILIGHIENEVIRINLGELRSITEQLISEFNSINICPKDTVFLAQTTGSNELYSALLLIALSSYGVRVFLPMFIQQESLEEWLKITGTSHILLPKKEIESLKDHQQEKTEIESILRISDKLHIQCHDITESFQLKQRIHERSNRPIHSDKTVQYCLNNSRLEDEFLILTTSGTSGRQKLVTFQQSAFLNSCQSWEKADLFHKNKLGGIGFTPLLAHSMGIRSLFNAIWNNSPICLIITEWFESKPEIVSYFLRQMSPEHITGGPAVYNLLFELARHFPELNDLFLNSIKSIVVSGAPLDKTFYNTLLKRFEIHPEYAFGTTETQQISNSLINPSQDFDLNTRINDLLPGVSIGLLRIDEDPSLFRLYVNSPFGYSRILNDNQTKYNSGYFNTGDLVQYNGVSITYHGRENIDFIKDQFGVKIPLVEVRKRYSTILNIAKHVEYYGIKDKPGLGALIYVENPSEKNGPLLANAVVSNYRNLIKSINLELINSMGSFEIGHQLIKRAVILNDNVPLNKKGIPSRQKINEVHHQIIDYLTDPLNSHIAVFDIDKDSDNEPNAFEQFHNPRIGQFLRALGVDHSFHRAEKDSLFTYFQGEEVEILDLTGGYGTNLLGHNNERLTSVVIDFFSSGGIPISDQASQQKYPALLAKKISLKLGALTGNSYKVMFGNSGSEAVEMAIQHALLSWKKEFEKIQTFQYQTFGGNHSEKLRSIWNENSKKIDECRCQVIALKQAYHGNTTSARSLLGNRKKRLPYKNLTHLDPLFIDDNDSKWPVVLQDYLNKHTIELKKLISKNGQVEIVSFTFPTIICSIVEPIRGEGGIRILNKEFLKKLASISIPLIVDEIQCGLGRSGSFVESKDINAQYYLFGKALGGNIAKISALCIEDNIFINEFGEHFVSTFSNGAFAAKIAFNTLEIIESENIPSIVSEKGELFKKRLNDVKNSYPTIIRSIEGKGLMLGIHFEDLSHLENVTLRVLYDQEKLGYLFTAYFYTVHQIRVFPTMSAPNVLRIEPSAYITDAEINCFINALECLCDLLKQRDLYQLLLPLMDMDPFHDHSYFEPRRTHSTVETASEGAVKVAFIAHYAHPIGDLKVSEPALQKASDTGIRIYSRKMQTLMEMDPFILFAKNLCNGTIHFTFILLPVDSGQLETLHRSGKRKKVLEYIQKAVDLAGSKDARIISLGGYTSIISDNGMAIVEPPNSQVITGNTLTVATGIYHLKKKIDELDTVIKNSKIGVIGAGGNIGKAVADGILSSKINMESLILFGRKERKLENVKKELIDNHGAFDISISTDLSELKHCDIIIVATNSNDPIVFAHHINKVKSVIVSDLSIPAAIHSEVLEMDNVVSIPFSAYINLPDDQDFMMSSITPKGSIFCCAAEAVVCGLEPNDLPLKGEIAPRSVQHITTLAMKHKLLESFAYGTNFKSAAHH